MRPVSNWLDRFRRPGVPAAASEELDAELLPVFATLDEIEQEAAAIRIEADAEAARRVEAAALEAERILVRWRREAEAERVRAEADRREAVASEARSIELRAEAEAAELRERGLERMPALVATVLMCLQEDQA
ncbi:MAG TPA: hypothetical protein VFL61_04895 [Gaiellaceae bacterium]|nr:hypothetical protein [Gaiellaceae bacterium]